LGTQSYYSVKVKLNFSRKVSVASSYNILLRETTLEQKFASMLMYKILF